MATYPDPFCRVHGYDFGSIIYPEERDSSGGGLGVEEIQVPARKYGDIRDKGRSPKKYKLRAHAVDREEIEVFLAELNNIPDGARIWPFDEERSGLIASAYAGLRSPEVWGQGKTFYLADAEITCREPWLYGPEQGILYQEAVTLPKVSELLTNEGDGPSGLDYLLARGGYSGSAYTEDLSFRLTPGVSSLQHDKELALCDKMMRGDVFLLDRMGNVEHSYETEFYQTYAGLQLDLHGSSFVSGGSMGLGYIYIGASGKLLMPFYGPLPACDPSPSLELWIYSLTGTPDVKVAFETNLSDLAAIDLAEDLVVGYNKIPIPDYEGEDFVAFGIVTGAGEAVVLTHVKGIVNRYIAENRMPKIDVGEDFKIRVEDTTNHSLMAMQATYRDLYYY